MDPLKEAKRRQAQMLLKQAGSQASRESYAPIPDPAMPTLASGEPLTGTQGLLPDIGRRADDFVRSMASGMTFNLADELAAGATALTSETPFSEALSAERARDVAIPPATAIPGELAGALMTGTGLAGRGVSFLAGAPKTLPSLAGRGAAEGAAYGAAFGAGGGEGLEDRLKGAARGGLTGAATGAGLGAISRGLMGAAPSRPTVEAIKSQATDAYRKAEQAGVIVKAGSFDKMVQNMAQKLAKAGMDKNLHPEATAAFQRLQRGMGSNQTLEGMEILRRVVKSAADSPSKDRRRVAQIMSGALDDFVSNMQPTDVLAGPSREAVSALKEARGLWHTASKAEVVNELVERAGNRAGQFTGSGYENALRTEFRSVVQNPKRLRQFSKTEQEFLRRVARGTPLGNAMRWLGKAAPRGIVSTALSSGVGYGAFGPMGAVAVPVAGELGRSAATSMTKGNVQKVLDQVLGSVTKGPVTISPQQAQLLRSAILTGVEGERAVSAARIRSKAPAR